jgi:hypothetical protein
LSTDYGIISLIPCFIKVFPLFLQKNMRRKAAPRHKK